MSTTTTSNQTGLIVEERYEDLGGVYFPILQQDGSRTMTKIATGHKRTDVIFLNWLRQHDRLPGKELS